MNHARRMWELLLPLGPYRRQGVYTAGELGAEGEALDGVGDALAELEREVMLDTAEGEGLEAYESLLAHRPVAGTPAGGPVRPAPHRRGQLHCGGHQR